MRIGDREINIKRWLLLTSIALGVLVPGFVIVGKGGVFALYRWQVPVTVRVVDSRTGTPIHNAIVSSAFTFGDQSHYERTNAVAEGPLTRFEISMQYCRAEGGLFDRFRARAHPVPSMYRFEITAAGFLPQRIDGINGELVEDPGKPDRQRFVLRLPEVKLQPLTR